MRRLCGVVFCLALALTLGQGLVRFRHVLGATGQQFIDLNRYDALVHVSIAQSILTGHGYTLPVRSSDGREQWQPALAKAPGYPFFLASLYRITGIGFSFFPLQCLIDACLCALVVLVSLEVFGDSVAALVAGIGAAANPVLVNAASQLYNENIYFCLFFLCVWMYLRWLRTLSLRMALLCGCCAGVTALVRESMLAPFAALIAWAAIAAWGRSHRLALESAVVMAAGLLLTVVPWTIHNYRATGEVVPISTISLSLLGAGNNACVSAAGWTAAFYGDEPCPTLNAQRAALLDSQPRGSEKAQLVYESRANAGLGLRYILQHPGEYFKLCLRRAWTVFDPWHPWQDLHGGRKIGMLLYFVVFVGIGIVGAVSRQARANAQARVLYLLLLISYAPLVAVFVSHDHRFALGIHLILGCFAGAWLARFSFFQSASRFLAA